MTIHKLEIVSHPHGIENIGDVAAYILSACGGKLPMMRLQLLAYYICAWDLAFHTQPLIETEFQAWVHGPVSRDLWNICGISARTLSVMSMVSDADVNGSPERLSPEGRVHIDDVLSSYGHLGMGELSDLVRSETPWLNARGDAEPAQKCATVILPQVMQEFYRIQAGKAFSAEVL